MVHGRLTLDALFCKGRKLMLHAPWSFAVLLVKNTLVLLRLVDLQQWRRVVVLAEHRNAAVAAAVALVVAVVDIELAVAYLPSCMEYMMLEGAAAVLDNLVLVVPYFVLYALIEMFEAPERRLAHPIHSFHDHDR
jgi:hypothetical protein